MKYHTIVADPPWQYEQSRIVTTSKTAQTRPEAAAQYATMSDVAIAALPVCDLAAPDAHLYVWVTNPRLFAVERIIEAWGFRYITLLTWVKQGTLGLGYYFRGQTEHVAFAVRGSLPIPPALRQRNVFEARKGRHSAKPDSFMDMVELVSPAPRLELFSRRARFGWDTWGDEALGHVDLADVDEGRIV